MKWIDQFRVLKLFFCNMLLYWINLNKLVYFVNTFKCLDTE